MENRGRILKVDFADAIGRTVKSNPLVAVDYGQILEIHGLPLPLTFECHFSKDGATAYKSIGTTTNGVGTVPFIDEQTQSGGIITAYIYLHETADDGETEYRIIIPVESRPGVTPAEPTPVEQDAIAQAISALNNAVTTTNANVAITEANKNASAEYAQNAYEYADDASRSASSAHESETNAEQARLEAVSARDRAIEARDTAHSEAQYAHSYAESAHTDAQNASASATSAQASAISAQQSATLAQQYASTATAKASEAMQSAQSASTSAQNASQSAQSAQNSATQANTSATSASASAQSATASEASASASAESAQASAESAQASADRAEQEADRWYEFLPVDSATGSLAHFTDGAKDVPVKALSVALELVQDLHGQDYPYPAGGGKNLFDGVVVAGYIGANGVIGGQGSASFCHSKPIPVQGGESYIWSGINNYVQNVKRLHCYDENQQWLSNPYFETINSTGVSYAIGGVLPANARYVALSFAREDTNVQFEHGTSATSYAPYSNICPITGHTQVVVNRDDGNGGNLQSITIPLGDTVYGGTLDVTNGVLTVEYKIATILTGSDNGVRNGNQQLAVTFSDKAPGLSNFKSNLFSIGSGAYQMTGHSATPTVEFRVPLSVLGVTESDSSTVRVNALKTWLSNNETQLCYELATPITVNLTPQQMTTLLGINNLWSDSGDVTVDYRADVQLYIQKMIANALNA